MERQDSESGSQVQDGVDTLMNSHGLDISDYDVAFLQKTIHKRLAETGNSSIASYLDHLKRNRSEAEQLFLALRISYSVFFRDPLVFALLEQHILPGLAAQKANSGQREIRVWSAGCSTGQEAWSVAMLLDELGTPGASAPPGYRVFATDRSAQDLAKAQAGVYRSEEVDNIRWRHLRSSFQRQDESYVISPRLRARVDFSAHDLLGSPPVSPAASIYGDFDLILCCNVLLYYCARVRHQLLDGFWRALSAGGYFVAGESERALVLQHEAFRAILPPAAIFQVKR